MAPAAPARACSAPRPHVDRSAMSDFSACFLLVFGQLAVGGLAALAVPPFAVLERGFYKSSAGVFLASAVVYLVGRARLAAGAGGMTAGTLVELALWLVFVVAASLYMASLWGD